MFYKPSRQASLPRPKDTRSKGEGGLVEFQLGWVIGVKPKKGRRHATVDVMLDDTTVVRDVAYPQGQSGPDRETHNPPAKRTRVGILFVHGKRLTAAVVAVYGRDGVAPDGDGEKGLYRRVFPNGMHMAVRDSGNVEFRFADGTSMVVGDSDDPQWDFTGQKREADEGDPFVQPELVDSPKPNPFGLTLKMADGSSMQFKDGKLSLELAKDATIHAKGNVNVQADGDANVTASGQALLKAGGQATVQAATVKVSTNLLDATDALLVKLPGGTLPIARVGDGVAFGAIVGPGNLRVLG